MSLEQDIEIVKSKLKAKQADDSVNEMILRFARFMPSPSKLNAASTISMNPSDKLAKWLMQREGEFTSGA